MCEMKTLRLKTKFPGGQLGTALQFLVSGFIADYWGWPAIFYVNGGLGAIWTVAYVLLGSDSPQKSRMIGDEEKLYIQTSLGQVGEQKVGLERFNYFFNLKYIILNFL